MSSMKGKVAYISGGTSGINLGIARNFARKGAAVLVFGRDADKAGRAADEIRRETSAKALGASADVRDYAAIAELFKRGAAELGAPDIVIAGAAGNFPAPAVDISANGFKTVIDIDLLGTYNVFRAGYDLITKPGGSMIAISAPQGTLPRPLQAHVCAAKAGINMLVRCLAMEWGAAGLRVNAISPGPIAGTEGVERLAPTDEAKQQWAGRLALRKLGTLEDIGELAAFMSSEASYMTGSIIECDGGSSLGDASGDFITSRKTR